MANKKIDGLDRAMLVEAVDHFEAENRRGKVFQASHVFSAVAAGGSVNALIVAGDSPLYIAIVVKSTLNTEIYPYKGTEVSANGSALDVGPTCINEVVSASPTADFYQGPTIDSDGTGLPSEFIPGGGKQNAQIGGEASVVMNYVFAANTTHLVRLTNGTSGDEGTFHFKATWVEG